MGKTNSPPFVVDEKAQQLCGRRLAAHPSSNATVRRSLHRARPNVDPPPHAHRSPLPRVVHRLVGYHLQQILNHLVVFRGDPNTAVERKTKHTCGLSDDIDPFPWQRESPRSSNVFFSHLFWTSSSLDVPAEEEAHTGFLIHPPSAVHAFVCLARRIQPFLSLVDHEVEFCVLTI